MVEKEKGKLTQISMCGVYCPCICEVNHKQTYEYKNPTRNSSTNNFEIK